MAGFEGGAYRRRLAENGRSVMHYQTPRARAASGISHAKQKTRNDARLYCEKSEVKKEESQDEGVAGVFVFPATMV